MLRSGRLLPLFLMLMLAACGTGAPVNTRAPVASPVATATPTAGAAAAPTDTPVPALATATAQAPLRQAAPTATAAVADPATPAPTAVDDRWQSNRVPPGYPTPTTAGVRLEPGGPPRDPGSLAWAHPGPYIGPAVAGVHLSSFSSAQRLATTYYFYWFDYPTPGRRPNAFDSPPDREHFSFLNPDTHEQQFKDMEEAGLDFALPVYWGEPGHPGRTTAETSPHYWSTEGIPAMVTALDHMRAEGLPPFYLGMFYDTTILANADLTTPQGKEYFYVNVRDFYSRIPPRYWAAIDNKPVVWLYDTLWVAKFDQASLAYLADRFARDFGGLRPYIVLEAQWQRSKGVAPPQTLHADGLYGWGAAANGFDPNPAYTVAEVGPGFKNTWYCKGGPAQNCFDVGRDGGPYYQHQLQQALATKANILAVETWNEYSEGTDVSDTVQFGRTYINLTRKYADLFKATRLAARAA